MVTFNFAKNFPHDASGVDNPNDWVWKNKNGIWYPVHLLVDCVISRPMYKTDANYLKGMQGIFYKGELIKRHYDNPNTPKSHEHLPFILLQYDDIDWKLAGYITESDLDTLL
jgi:hypothetical protein